MFFFIDDIIIMFYKRYRDKQKRIKKGLENYFKLIGGKEAMLVLKDTNYEGPIEPPDLALIGAVYREGGQTV